ncbi:MAG: hypothetical protein WBL20_17100 [Sphingobium sp.]|uniref:hypothetical protein n=1 Tax=Sphingobium sp. TaxID=1912891 RepID=UPI003BB1E703
MGTGRVAAEGRGIRGRDALRLVHGGRDLVETLEHWLEKARAGELEIVVVATVDRENVQTWGWAHVDGIAAPWARMVAAVAGASHDLMTQGLD